MKDFIRELLLNVNEIDRKRAILREYLQARTLQILQDEGAFTSWAFLGGTALRFLYSLPRFSEDLDFSLVESDNSIQFVKMLTKIKGAFNSESYSLRIKLNDRRAVNSAFIIFDGLLYELELSAHSSETLSIKIELDTNPPYGADLETTIVRRHVIINIMHYDKASLLAGKLHAILSRKYTKGRDIYDLMWYLSDKSWPAPNFELLNNALKQSKTKSSLFTLRNWKRLLAKRFSSYDWKLVIKDVLPFLERVEDRQLISKDNILSVLKG
jgi:predicted nucleotidyltransferase component of viral defense system